MTGDTPICDNGHIFIPGRDEDTPEWETGDPRWCNVCGVTQKTAPTPPPSGSERSPLTEPGSPQSAKGDSR
ncbi:MAG: hypothetical protein NVSMB4_20270 [Acidimicrobiales bacterium]